MFLNKTVVFEGLFCSTINTTAAFGVWVNISPVRTYFVTILMKRDRLRNLVADTYFPADVTQSKETS